MNLLLAGVLSVALGVTVSGFRVLTESYVEQTVEQATIDEVKVVGGSGNVTVTAGSVDHVQLSTTVGYSGERPTADHSVQGRALVLNTRCGNQCKVSYSVTLPSGVRVTGANTSGSVAVRNVADGVTVTTRSGNIQLESLRGNVNVTASSGDVTGTDLSGGVTVSTSSGGVTLTMAQPPSSGDVDITVPQGLYRVTTVAKSGAGTSGCAERPERRAPSRCAHAQRRHHYQVRLTGAVRGPAARGPRREERSARVC